MDYTKRRKLASVGLVFTFIGFIAAANAHDNHAHKPSEKLKTVGDREEEILTQINVQYLENVKPIFERSCLDCHSSNTRYPWYATLPGAKQLIESDGAESKMHLDMTNDFPFDGHGTPVEDLKAIAEVLDNGSMPPVRYWIMHPASKPTTDDKKTVTDWVQKALATLDARGVISNSK